MSEDKCKNEAEKSIKLKRLVFDINGQEKTFEIAKTECVSDNYESDVCDTCTTKGLGKYGFDITHGFCDFALICVSEFIGDSDSLYLKEI